MTRHLKLNSNLDKISSKIKIFYEALRVKARNQYFKHQQINLKKLKFISPKNMPPDIVQSKITESNLS